MVNIENLVFDKGGRTEAIVAIQPTAAISEIPSKLLVKEYKIGRYFSGKFFVRRLIRKIFKYKLTQQLRWKKTFWENLKIYKVQCSLTHNELQTLGLTIENYIQIHFNPKRVESIVKYQRLLSSGHQFDYPLYITGKALNYLGGTVETDRLYMLDGARRIIARLLNKENPIMIYIATI